MLHPPTIQLRDICQQLEIRERDARYVLEEGHIPSGVDQAPESGNHRRFTPRQAFWLAMVLKLKAIGLKTPLAAKTADYAEQSLQTVTQQLNFDSRFFPKAGRFNTEHQYFVDLGDSRYIRLVTDAAPGRKGRLQEFDWHDIEHSGRPLKEVSPCAMIRLDLTRIAKLLAGAFQS